MMKCMQMQRRVPSAVKPFTFQRPSGTSHNQVRAAAFGALFGQKAPEGGIYDIVVKVLHSLAQNLQLPPLPIAGAF